MTKDRVVIIGLGKVGSTFASALKEVGYEVEAIKGQAEFEAFISQEIIQLADIIMITTPDSKISYVVDELAKHKRFRNYQTVMHMSGACTSDLLLKAKSFGADVCSLHPLQSFANTSIAVNALPDTVFSVEGDEQAIIDAKRMVELLKAKVFEIRKETKPLYHAAACIAANYLVTIMKNSLDLLETAGIPKGHCWEALEPLVKGSIKNIDNLGVSAALTGPISRGDSDTIKNHLENLHEQKKEVLNLYKCLGEYTVDVARNKGDITEKKACEIKELLRRQEDGAEKNNH